MGKQFVSSTSHEKNPNFSDAPHKKKKKNASHVNNSVSIHYKDCDNTLFFALFF